MDVDTGKNALAQSLTVAQEHELCMIALNVDLTPRNISPSLPEGHLSPWPDASSGEAREEQSPIHTFGSSDEYSDIQTERNKIDYKNICIYPQGDSAEVIHPSECAAVPAGETTPLASINDVEATAIVHTQGPPMLRARTTSLETTPRDETGPDHRLNGVQTAHTELRHVQMPSPTRSEDEEDFGHPCEEFSSSLPPSSSPPQVFSSSPRASSQSSAGDVEPSRMMFADDVDGCASSCDYADRDDVVPVAWDRSHSQSDLPGHEVTKPPELGEQMGASTSCIEDDLKLSGKRSVDPEELCGSQPNKRPKSDSLLCQPPAPKRVTLVSQNRQFKKLTTPFRPPLKLPIVTDGSSQTMIGGKVASTINTTRETCQHKTDLKRSAITARRKASNTSRSATQFKSPLVDAVHPTDSRSIRLTPALQTLERKLQVLKRAIKVKQENEEEVLGRLTGKWIEAGREVAYEVWEATKEAGEFSGRAAFVRRSYGWENDNDGNTPWGWDTKTGDASEESCSVDPSGISCATGRPTPEDDDDVFHNNLGTMLRQLGIAPEIFGWDDDKEAFSN